MTYHEPVMLQESVEGLNILPDGIYVDLTFGGGGHSAEILKRLDKGLLIAFDQDAEAEKNKIEDRRFLFIRQNFAYLKNYLRYLEIEHVDGILADLGVSSHHFDDPSRGFSFRFEGNLDMRMNTSNDFTAAKLVNEYPEKDLIRVFKKYGEIDNGGKLAGRIVKYRTEKTIDQIADLLESIKDCIPVNRENKYLAKVFQAMRIEVNHEMESLEQMLEQTAKVLNKRGRLVVITYHSLEDRLVKNFIKKGKFSGEPEKDFFGNLKVPFKAVNRSVITAGKEELSRNNRARSAKLRIAEKL
ncbi:MAG TPA: 16S rRNA (cytosine(1402)-N(4))-methyltransferase RsmH [Bacteroidales bacterium]|nr:16S rRNA (cytosine(1402)-N(4))-methyltransferase RsmH [Bacteroidales bacterium]